MASLSKKARRLGRRRSRRGTRLLTAVGHGIEKTSDFLNTAAGIGVVMGLAMLAETGGQEETPALAEAGESLGSAVEQGTNFVYSIEAEGQTAYVGITNDLTRRAAEHGKDLQMIASGLTRLQARGVEQALINLHGMEKNGGQLLNKINSIAQSNAVYKEAVAFGEHLLKSLGIH